MAMHPPGEGTAQAREDIRKSARVWRGWPCIDYLAPRPVRSPRQQDDGRRDRAPQILPPAAGRAARGGRAPRALRRALALPRRQGPLPTAGGGRAADALAPALRLES